MEPRNFFESQIRTEADKVRAIDANNVHSAMEMYQTKGRLGLTLFVIIKIALWKYSLVINSNKLVISLVISNKSIFWLIIDWLTGLGLAKHYIFCGTWKVLVDSCKYKKLLKCLSKKNLVDAFKQLKPCR